MIIGKLNLNNNIMENTIDLTKLNDPKRNLLLGMYNVLLGFEEEKKEEDKELSVDNICADYIVEYGLRSKYDSLDIEITRRVHALTVLLLCAKEVNGGELPVTSNKGTKLFCPYIEINNIREWTNIEHTNSPFYLKNTDAYNKFMSIKGIETYIRMYYGK